MTDRSRTLDPQQTLPHDADRAVLVGRAWLAVSAERSADTDAAGGPTLVTVRDGTLIDIGALAPTTATLLAMPDVAARVRAFVDSGHGIPLGPLSGWLDSTCANLGDQTRARLLSPNDLQVVKAAGVTFVDSMVERVIEEQARGDASRAQAVRREVTAAVGDNLAAIRPGSERAMQLKEVLVAQKLWSQYLEVGIGPDAEIFTKAAPLASVGTGVQVGLHPKSTWNNPEPEIVLAVSPSGEIVGAALGNDVNLRDFEGRSALLLGKAKDNNGSCAIGPFIRLFDEHFGIDDVRNAVVSLHVEGEDGFTLEGSSSMSRISRDPLELVGHAMGGHHQYPDGILLFCGTMFAPIQDRDAPGAGFTHHIGDRVTIASERLGALVNWVDHSDRIPPWTFGIEALMRNLARRGRLA
ncbi:fumarylacetoacetate hydrolase family protein [Variovorax sp. RHLX14]|uniref:fumarylacetoacetate hydrolase family protein n=1 Tax=Variovorax sp. RHLX14 TaxID=1259731 RepID=UPI003F455F1C